MDLDTRCLVFCLASLALFALAAVRPAWADAARDYLCGPGDGPVE